MSGDSFAFEEVARVLPEPVLLLASDGRILSANPAVGRTLGLTADRLTGRRLQELVTDSAGKVKDYLGACARSGQMVLGALTWSPHGDMVLTTRCEGAALRPASGSSPALVLLRIKPRESASTRFTLLNRKIEELNKEIHLRQQTQRELQEREAELRKLNEDLEERVKGRTEELSYTNDELRQRNQQLQEFAYVASHDLQEPLRKIVTFADLLRADYGDRLEKEGLEYLKRMQDASSRMSRLISDLLSYSRIATMAQEFEKVRLNDIAAEVLSDLETRVSETGGRVDVAPLPTIEADALQMRQLFQNLIGNALKFHRPGVPPVVKITARVAEDQTSVHPNGQAWCELVFEDNGIGFEDRFIGRLFAPFQRLHGRSAYEGTGMGLAICRRIVERHGGSITARSTPGEGSEFAVRLPFHQRTPDPGRALPEQE